MKAVILAGGYGKRLKPLTDSIPKPLVSVGGRPIIEWQILWLKHSGITSFVILVGHLKEKVIEYLDSKKSDLGASITYSEEESPLGTGGALKNAEQHLKDEDKFIMFNGDNVTNINISWLSIDGNVASLGLVPLRSTYGITLLDGDIITKFDEKPILKDYWMNAGVYLMTKEIFKYLPEEGNMENTAFVELAGKKLLKGVKFPDAYFKGVDSIKDMEEVNADLAKHSIFGSLGQ